MGSVIGVKKIEYGAGKDGLTDRWRFPALVVFECEQAEEHGSGIQSVSGSEQR